MDLAHMAPYEVRKLIRDKKITGQTSGMCLGYAQANLAILLKELAYDFLLFTQRNPKPCPILEVSDVGDGSFKMNCNELATVATQNLPIVILLFNNNALGMVRQWQNLFSDKRYSETDIYDKTDYIMLANAYGIEGHKAQNLDELHEILGSLILDKPVFVECKIDHDINVFPIVPPNDNLLNLICN